MSTRERVIMRSNTKAGCLKTSSSGQSSWVTLYSLRIKRLQNDYLKELPLFFILNCLATVLHLSIVAIWFLRCSDDIGTFRVGKHDSTYS
jgi:hypothetical protein